MDRASAIKLLEKYDVDTASFGRYLVHDWLSGSQAEEAVRDYLTNELDVNLDEDDDEEIEKLENDLWNQPTGAPPVKKEPDDDDDDVFDLNWMRQGEGI